MTAMQASQEGAWLAPLSVDEVIGAAAVAVFVVTTALVVWRKERARAGLTPPGPMNAPGSWTRPSPPACSGSATGRCWWAPASRHRPAR